MLETKGETQLHKAIVASLIRYFRGQGWAILAAAAAGFPEPYKVGRHEPDLIGMNGSKVIVYGEAKTGDGDIGTQHSREQYHDFSSRVMTGSGVACPLYLCVPKGQEPELRRVLSEEGLANKPNITVLVYG